MNIIASLIETDPETAETVVEDLVRPVPRLAGGGRQPGAAARRSSISAIATCGSSSCASATACASTGIWIRSPAGLEIPLLTLQPLLENAIYHGIQPLPEGGTIEVALRIVGERVEFVLANPLPPPDSPGQAHGQGNRMALANIRSRLAVLYGPAARLDAGIEGERFVTRLSYPLVRGGEAAADDRRS
ncbi:MAG: hypothetical protein U5R48_05240 [Gammaproteobacteria bacterium]|nr:hypothetical protein [Gammaproteobacteria bacterium]